MSEQPNLDLLNRFSSHQVDGAGQQRMQMIRLACLDVAQLIQGTVPAGREQSLALTKLQEVMMWANAGISVHHPII